MESASQLIDTPRLRGAPRTSEGFADLRRLHSDRAVMRTLSADGEPLSEEQTRQSLQAGAEHWAANGFGVWHFHARADDDFIGYCGLKRTAITGQPEVELLYAVGSWAWRQGYASEMGRAVVDLARGPLALGGLIAFTLTENRASRAVMERLGFIYERPIVHVGLEHVLYRL